jgi:hypothetical protein
MVHERGENNMKAVEELTEDIGGYLADESN